MTPFEQYITTLRTAAPLLNSVTLDQAENMSGVTDTMVEVIWLLNWWFGDNDWLLRHVIQIIGDPDTPDKYTTSSHWTQELLETVNPGIEGWRTIGVL